MFKPRKKLPIWPINLLLSLGRREKQKVGQTPESGFTLIESLVALLVAALLLTGIAPMVALSVAARVQSKRIDVATQAARTYIDGLRSGVFEPPTNNAADFTLSDLGVPAPGTNKPTGPGTCFNPKDPNIIDANDSKCDTTYSFVIQAFRDGPTDTATVKTAAKTGYCLGIRVYRRDAFQTPPGATATEPTKSIFSASTGNKSYPLVVMRTEMVNKTSFSEYKSHYKDSSGNDKTTPCNPA